MRKLSVFLVILMLCALGGCETAKGFKKDMSNTWENLKGADDWVKENLW